MTPQENKLQLRDAARRRTNANLLFIIIIFLSGCVYSSVYVAYVSLSPPQWRGNEAISLFSPEILLSRHFRLSWDDQDLLCNHTILSNEALLSVYTKLFPS